MSRFGFFNFFNVFFERISIEFFDNKIVSFLPYIKSISKNYTFSWISDSVRFCVDGFYLNRLLKNFFFFKSNYIIVEKSFTVQFLAFFMMFFRIYFKVVSLFFDLRFVSDFMSRNLFNFFVMVYVQYSNLLDLQSFFFFNSFFFFSGFLVFLKKKTLNLILKDWFCLYLLSNDDLLVFNNLLCIIFAGFEPRFSVPLLNVSFRKKAISLNIIFIYLGSCLFSNFKLLNLGYNISNFYFNDSFNMILSLIILKKKVKFFINPEVFPTTLFFSLQYANFSLVFVNFVSIASNIKNYGQILNFKFLPVDMKKMDFSIFFSFLDFFFLFVSSINFHRLNNFFANSYILFFFGSHGLFFYSSFFVFIKYDFFISTNLFVDFLNIFIDITGTKKRIFLLNLKNQFYFNLLFLFFFLVTFINFVVIQLFSLYLFFNYILRLKVYYRIQLFRKIFSFFFYLKLKYCIDFCYSFLNGNFIFNSSKQLSIAAGFFSKSFPNYNYLISLC